VLASNSPNAGQSTAQPLPLALRAWLRTKNFRLAINGQAQAKMRR